jgi:peptide deformylase
MYVVKKENIITLPHPNLRKKSQKVHFVDDSIKEVIANMESATLDWEASREHEIGVALAGVQINELLRIVVIKNDFDDKNDQSYTVYINPKIIKYMGEIEYDFEGCLSIKDVYGKVPRNTKVKVEAKDIEGNTIRVTAEGFLARVFQHEIDHTNGIVFIDHIKEDTDAFYRLQEDGKLVELDYDSEIKKNNILWQ